ncbi:unnamed protein product [Tilletia laevis]|uniref:Uncharacterized protein n=2 Tax=Tilletia TaxID=13289 RepID=A0A8X7MYX8_9BASI|nr:hypothetical protein CF336_g1708 [Tilletia laevis]KAE8203432.1 hypothetical protein CF328_g1656 [Tilletia controversa]CAD6885963.1 unnamed protein product [Tilletia caries]KAE8253053.1 hypothetical protein A4X06_0g1730 [Tilletia controversa]CAD6947914.1 unnamed protein product [Tilletia laevis]
MPYPHPTNDDVSTTTCKQPFHDDAQRAEGHKFDELRLGRDRLPQTGQTLQQGTPYDVSTFTVGLDIKAIGQHAARTCRHPTTGEACKAERCRSAGAGCKNLRTCSRISPPSTLELAGKLAVSVETLPLWDTTVNCGHTCIASNIILCSFSVENKLGLDLMNGLLPPKSQSSPAAEGISIHVASEWDKSLLLSSPGFIKIPVGP